VWAWPALHMASSGRGGQVGAQRKECVLQVRSTSGVTGG
jgi:hypothetical protein